MDKKLNQFRKTEEFILISIFLSFLLVTGLVNFLPYVEANLGTDVNLFILDARLHTVEKTFLEIEKEKFCKNTVLTAIEYGLQNTHCGKEYYIISDEKILVFTEPLIRKETSNDEAAVFSVKHSPLVFDESDINIPIINGVNSFRLYIDDKLVESRYVSSMTEKIYFVVYIKHGLHKIQSSVKNKDTEIFSNVLIY